MLKITSLYLGLNSIIFVILSFQVVSLRRKHSVLLGDGGETELNQAIRAFGNNAEYLAVLILILAGLELNGVHSIILNIIGILYTLGRILHAYAIYGKLGVINRIIGMVITYTLIGLGSCWLIIKYFI